MTQIGSYTNYKIVPEDSSYVIGSSSKNTSGELYAIDISFKIRPQTNLSQTAPWKNEVNKQNIKIRNYWVNYKRARKGE